MNSNSELDQALQLISKHQPRLLCVVGPTASGKSDLAAKIASEIIKRSSDLPYNGVELINADSYSLYRKMDIGTAKPTLQERSELLEQGILYHFIDVLDPIETSTVAEYAKAASAKIDDIQQEGKLPIVVGGSGLYVRALTDGFEFQGYDLELRAKITEHAAEVGEQALWEELNALDSDTAATLAPENTRRVIRALEVIQTHQGTHIEPAFKHELPPYTYADLKTLQIGFDVAREEIDERIEQRTNMMREFGLTQEVRALWESDELGPTAIKAIGYAEMVQFFEGGVNPADGKLLTEDTTYELIAMHTKRLVRRQQSWFKRDPRIVWL
jgi:tRNA dimethylallyltransferase